jgi:transposase
MLSLSKHDGVDLPDPANGLTMAQPTYSTVAIQQEGRSMNESTIIGIDLSKRFMQVCVVDENGTMIEEARVARDRLVEMVARHPGAVVAMEACGGAHHWGRSFEGHGHEVRLIAPYVAKAYRDPACKDDRRDARAITEAGGRRHVRPIPVKDAETQALQSLERIEALYARQHTQLGNALRGLLAEFGIVLPRGPGHLKRRFPELMASPRWAAVPAALHEALSSLFEQFVATGEKLVQAKKRLTGAAVRDPRARLLTSVPGIGPLTMAGFMAAVGDPARFSSGRHLAAWLGLTPRLYQSGDTRLLLGISKRGNERLRSLFVIGAQSMLRRYGEGRYRGDPLAEWARALLKRKPRNVAAVALANKLARIAWRVAVNGQPYQPRRT